MKNIVFLSSGQGGNLKFIAQAVASGWLVDVAVSAVVSDRECGANAFARANGIATTVESFREEDQDVLIARLERAAPDIVVTNVHKILRPRVLDAFEDRFLNLHYSILPAFAGSIGSKTVSEALAFGSQFVGATAHHVTEDVDAGRPIVQSVVPVKDDDTLESLMDVVFRAGCLTLFFALEQLLVCRKLGVGPAVVSLKGRPVMINPASPTPVTFDDEELWRVIAS